MTDLYYCNCFLLKKSWIKIAMLGVIVNFVLLSVAAAQSAQWPVEGGAYRPVEQGEFTPPCSVLTTYLAGIEQQIWNVLSQKSKHNDTKKAGWPWMLEVGNKRTFYE